ncbi:MAG: helix-turn-helix transcriptional regulator [Gammaproteobacteria bacterium]|nr:helix-turn-helix transcriptional regulator [Gammaproteobacteria bacterium]
MPKFSIKKFRENLTHLMDAAKISMTELYKNTNIPITTIQRLRNDPKANPTISSLKPIADFFSLTIDELISGDLTKLSTKKGVYKENKQYWTKVPILTWKEAINWKAHLKKESPVVTTDIDISSSAYALKIEEDLDDGFRKNSTIIIDPEVEAENMDYLISYKSDSKLPILKQLREHDGDLYLKPLVRGIAPTPFKEEYIVLGVVRQIKLDL